MFDAYQDTAMLEAYLRQTSGGAAPVVHAETAPAAPRWQVLAALSVPALSALAILAAASWG